MNWENYVMPKNISGPVSLSVYKKEDKMIYMFGDIHINNQGCYRDEKTIDQVIRDILELYPGRVDFFLETIPEMMRFTRERDPRDSYLRRLVEAFQDCFHPKHFGRNCEFKDRHRFHYIDFRLLDPDLFKVQNKATDYIRAFQLFLWNSSKYFKLKRKKTRTEEEEKFFTSAERLEKIFLENNRDLDKLLPDMLKIFKIQKQLDDVEKNERIIIQNVFYDKIDAFFKYARVEQTLQGQLQFAIDFLCVIMDIYSVARMFRKFKDDSPKNILVYTGKYHAVDFQDYFVALGCTPIFGQLTEADRINSRNDIILPNVRQCVKTKGLEKWFTR